MCSTEILSLQAQGSDKMNQYLFKYLEKQEATTPEGDDVYEWQLCVCHEKSAGSLS